MIDRVVAVRDLVEMRVYPSAHHSFDALGLPARYLDGVKVPVDLGAVVMALLRPLIQR